MYSNDLRSSSWLTCAHVGTTDHKNRRNEFSSGDDTRAEAEQERVSAVLTYQAVLAVELTAPDPLLSTVTLFARLPLCVHFMASFCMAPC